MISKVRNGYKLKVGYGNKKEVLNHELIGYYYNPDKRLFAVILVEAK